MSSTNVSTVLAQLLSEVKSMNGRLSALESHISAKPSPAPASVSAAAGGKKAKKERDPDAPKRAPTAWVLFTGRVRSVLSAAGFEKKDLGVDTIMFSSSLKEENAELDSWSDADILARRAAWVKPEVSKKKGSAPASVVLEDGEVGEEPAKKERKNPWAGLTPEQKAERVAKMKAGKAAKKSSEASSEEAPASDGEAASAPASVTSSEKKKRGPKKFSEMSPEEVAEAKAKRAAKKEAKSTEAPKAVAALPALPASPKSGALDGFQRVMLSGAAYWVNLSSGHCYHRLSDGGQGEWAGIFHRTPKPHIDDSVPEPSEDDGFVLEEA